MLISASYKFYLAIENTILPDYVTEKASSCCACPPPSVSCRPCAQPSAPVTFLNVTVCASVPSAQTPPEPRLYVGRLPLAAPTPRRRPHAH